MLIAIPEWVFWVYIALSGGFVLLLSLAIWLWFFKLPRPAKTLFWCFVKNKPSEIVTTDDNTIDVLMKEVDTEGQMSGEAEQRGRKRTDFKIMPRSSHPIFESKFFWKGSGVPGVFSYAGKIVANNPLVLALMSIASDPDAKFSYDKDTKMARIRLDPNKTKDFFKGAYDESQVQSLIAEERRDAREEAEKPISAKVVGFGIIFLFVIVAIWIVFTGGGGG